MSFVPFVGGLGITHKAIPRHLPSVSGTQEKQIMKTIKVTGESISENVPLMKVVYYPNGEDSQDAELVAMKNDEMDMDSPEVLEQVANNYF